MEHDILVYFAGERRAAVTAMTFGLTSLGIAWVAWQPRKDQRSLTVVFAVCGLLELAIGVGLYLKTEPQVDQLLAQFTADAARARAHELARMARVQQNFVVLVYVWLTVIAASLVVALTQRARPAVWGAALALALQAVAALSFDLTAKLRGARYLEALSARH